MNDHPTQVLADLIHEFLSVALSPESRKRLEAEASSVGGATYEQFLAMSLSQLIANRFDVTPVNPLPSGSSSPVKTMALNLSTVTIEEFKKAAQIVYEAIREGDPQDEDGFLATAMREVPLIGEIALEMFKRTIPGNNKDTNSQVTALYASPSAQCIVAALYLIDQSRSQ